LLRKKTSKSKIGRQGAIGREEGRKKVGIADWKANLRDEDVDVFERLVDTFLCDQIKR